MTFKNLKNSLSRDPKRRRRAKLVRALRSGNYIQTQGRLSLLKPGNTNDSRPIGDCCLGVACKVAVADGVPVAVSTTTEFDNAVLATYDGEEATLPNVVREYFGFKSDSGSYNGGDDEMFALTSDNDNGETFAQIADRIEAEPRGLIA